MVVTAQFSRASFLPNAKTLEVHHWEGAQAGNGRRKKLRLNPQALCLVFSRRPQSESPHRHLSDIIHIKRQARKL